MVVGGVALRFETTRSVRGKVFGGGGKAEYTPPPPLRAVACGCVLQVGV